MAPLRDFIVRQGFSIFFWRDYCNKELSINTDNWYLTHKKKGEPHTLLRLKMCLPSKFKWLQDIHKTLIYL